MRKSILLPAAALAVVLVCTVLARAGVEFSTLSRSLVRFHVVGNSDSVRDQAVKLAVRDAVLDVTAPRLSELKSRADAEARISEMIPLMEDAANTALARAGAPYTASVTLGNRYFPTKSYPGFRLPAGRYDAVTVTLGAGAGRNFWCVLFPPLCLSAASLDCVPNLSSGTRDALTGETEYRFLALELAGRLEALFTEKNS